ncbi:hypothetical protein C0995_010291, partial [Termitomyces sp. Mi166
LAMLVPLHKTVFGLLEGLLDNWHLLNLDSVKWRCKAEVCQACVNLWSLDKQAPYNSIEWRCKAEPSQWAAPYKKSKGKAKTTEEDEDEEDEAAQKLRKELEDFVVPTKVSFFPCVLGFCA